MATIFSQVFFLVEKYSKDSDISVSTNKTLKITIKTTKKENKRKRKSEFELVFENHAHRLKRSRTTWHVICAPIKSTHTG